MMKCTDFSPAPQKIKPRSSTAFNSAVKICILDILRSSQFGRHLNGDVAIPFGWRIDYSQNFSILKSNL